MLYTDSIAEAIKRVDLGSISTVELVKLLREANNADCAVANRISLTQGLAIANALKAAYEKGYNKAIDFVAGG